MIFNNELPLTEQEKFNIVRRDANIANGFIFKSVYDSNNIILSNFTYDDNGLLMEQNIDQDNLGIPRSDNKRNSRYIMITGGDEAQHPGRMKVSSYGSKIKRNNKNQYISIYRSNKDTISYVGDLHDIDMSHSELLEYEDLFQRNEALIQYVRFSNGKYNDYIDNAFVNDENLRKCGYNVIRDRNTGNAMIYKDNILVRKENIKGEIIC